ncbi:AAA family ATPase [Candidatus Poriferisodalis sp.]|uniref:AAA family ATPase n=1 Tax=Candidatus Poriferisodalis sp. TaxID=3101277 RepID=UPI003B013D68
MSTAPRDNWELSPIPNLSEILGRGEQLAELWRYLSYEQLDHETLKIVLLRGPVAVGKTSLLKQLARDWEVNGGRVIIAEGDKTGSDEAMYPLSRGLYQTHKFWQSTLPVIKTAAKLGETLILGSGGVVAETLTHLMAIGNQRAAAKRPYMKPKEQQALHQLAQAAGDKPLLIIADNLHKWDEASLRFLARIGDPRFRSAYQFLRKAKIVAAEPVEAESSIEFPEAHSRLLQPLMVYNVDLPSMTRSQFPNVLQALGAPRGVSDVVSDTIFDLTGGNLVYASECARRLTSAVDEALEQALSDGQFGKRLMQQRFHGSGKLTHEAAALLKVAAVLGSTFQHREVACALDLDVGQVPGILSYCKDRGVIDFGDEVGQFVHELIRNHFFEELAHEKVEVHGRLVDCFRHARPADYEARCLNALNAGRRQLAATLAVQARLACHRDSSSRDELPEAVQRVIEASEYVALADQLERVQELIRVGDISMARQHVAELPPALPRSLLGEVEYLRSHCMLLTRSAADRVEALRLLTRWSDYWGDEPELGLRLNLLRLSALSLAVDKTEAYELHETIRSFLIDHLDADTWAEEALYTLDRCAARLDEPGSSTRRVRRAAIYFAPDAVSGVVRRPLEYYRAQVNLVAELTIVGEYHTAVAAAKQLDEFIERHEDGVFPRESFPAGNRILAEYRAGHIDPAEAASRQRRLVETFKNSQDPFYGGNALAVYLILSGNSLEPASICEELIARYESRPNPEPNLRYVLRANNAMRWFLMGEIEVACVEWERIETLVLQNPYPIARSLVSRHKLLAEVLGTGQRYTPRELDECLLNIPSMALGPEWDQLGRAFRLPEIEWWR